MLREPARQLTTEILTRQVIELGKVIHSRMQLSLERFTAFHDFQTSG